MAHSDAATLVLRVTNGYWGYSAATGASLWNLTLNYPVTSNEAFPLGRGVDDFIVFNPSILHVIRLYLLHPKIIHRSRDTPWVDYETNKYVYR